MTVFTRRVVTVAALLLLLAGLAGCGDSEADQRQAFIKFLESINHRAGSHFLRPRPEEESAFGGYLRHYTIVLEFNKDIIAAGKDYADAMKKLGAGPGNEARTFDQMIARRQLMPAVKAETTKFMRAIETHVTKLIAERGALQQPDDLKAVYNATINKLDTTPAQAMVNSHKALLDLTDSSMRLVDYVNEHPGKVTVSGLQFRANDAKTQTELGAILKLHQENGKRFQDAQRNGQSVLQGS